MTYISMTKNQVVNIVNFSSSSAGNLIFRAVSKHGPTLAFGMATIAASCAISACSLGDTRQMTIVADSPALGLKGISLPATVQMTELGRFHAEVDASWLASHFEQLARKRLPKEGGSGGDRYSFRNFSLTANSDGTLRGFVHVTLDNYKYTKKPWGGQWDWRSGHVESDVTAIITPLFKDGHPTTVTSTRIVKTNASGFVKVWNNALPKIWFSLDRKLQTATNKANKKAGIEVAVLKVQENPDLDPFIDDILKRGLVGGKNIKFIQADNRLTLVLDYQVVGGLTAYYEIYQSYKNNAYKPHSSQTATVPVAVAKAPKPRS
jgi:hypothetical protein